MHAVPDGGANAFDVAIIIMAFALLTLMLFSNGKSVSDKAVEDIVSK
ncbi:hypothetical protein JAU75_23245 [Ochrobactrum sp. Q0168]|nr:hypothetical protein [Ochrobactrum sp. Q0168]